MRASPRNELEKEERMRQEFETDEVVERKPAEAKPAAEAERPEGVGFASAIGNHAVQRVARSSALQRSPAAAGLVPSSVLARQAEEEEGEAGGGTATAEATPEAGGGAEGAAPATEGAEAAAPATEASSASGAEGAAPATEAGGGEAAAEEETESE
jgi:hypothetical protein